ncbi:hypothetical protein Ddye_022628 [Dipteronia dyeriana]|uniref:NB-ARC domain-containing protein n=1 Tax=Dipteronia dyeriana TaxID=168575 RepID=A0AAD9TRF4_9ROSI|nr:hypothetical protein Ddye_022628 [Dipteronia dyeriana]
MIMSRSGSRRPLLPQRGSLRNKVYSEILGDITDLIAGESVLLRGSEDQIEAIEKDLREWQDALAIAEEKEGSSNEYLTTLEESRQLALKAQEILNAFVAKRKRQPERSCFIKFVFFFDDLIAEHRFKKEITEIRCSIPLAILRRQQLNKVPISRLEIGQPSASSPDDFTKESETEVGLVRLDQFHDKDMGSMLTGVRGVGEGRCVISIVGISGVGKTTFAKRIYEDSGIVRSFPIRAWVTVSNESQPEAVLLSIIEQVNVAGFHHETMEFKEMLSGFLCTGRYFIVLDDFMKKEYWDTLQAAFPDISNGSRIIITTPNKDVALHASSIKPFELQPLSDEAGWEFFKTKVQVPDELETIGKAIVRRCMGIPQMISETGASLSLSPEEATVEQWKRKLEELKRDQASRYEALSEAANTLPSNLKQCLFYFGLFKEDYNIPARRLVVLWVAEGLVRQERNNEESPESIAEKRLKKLVEQDMIQVVKRRPDGRVKTCRMHIILRDLWESKAKNANFFHIDSNSTSSATEIRRLADHLDKEYVCFPHIHGNDRANISDFKSHYKNLCTFLSFDTREGDIPGDDIGNFLYEGIFRSCFQGLRVLDLERVFRPKLPESIGKLTHLRYLGLRWTYLERLPTSINNLLNLQTLDLKNTYISVIPSSLWQMRQLRHLYLSENYRSRFVGPKGASSLTNLQTLWGAFVDDEVSVDGLKWLTNLRKLGLVFQLEALQPQMILVRRILRMKSLESLRLVSIDKSVKPSSIYFDSLSDLENLSSLYLLGKLENISDMYLPVNLPGKLTDLTLSLSKLDKDPMEELGQLQNLKILKLFCNAYSKSVMRCRRGSFPELRVLKLWKQENLEEWFLYEGSLKVLRELEIRRCENLKEIPHGIEHLLLLRSLTLTDMPKDFTARVKKNQGKDWEKIAHVPSLNITPPPDMTRTGEGSSYSELYHHSLSLF